MRLHHITLLYLFDSELLNSGKRDLEMLLEAGEGKRMLSLMSWPSYFLYQVPSHLSWTRHPLCAWRSVIWTWGSLIFTNKVSLVQFNIIIELFCLTVLLFGGAVTTTIAMHALVKVNFTFSGSCRLGSHTGLS